MDTVLGMVQTAWTTQRKSSISV